MVAPALRMTYRPHVFKPLCWGIFGYSNSTVGWLYWEVFAFILTQPELITTADTNSSILPVSDKEAHCLEQEH